MKLRKIITAALTAAIAAVCLLCSLPASADVLWEPYNDSYYEKHRDNMKVVQRPYVIPEEMPVYSNPDRSPVGTISAGIVYIYYTNTRSDGTVWGSYVADYRNDTIYWINLTNIEPLYNLTSFNEEHKDEFTEYNKEYEGRDRGGKSIVIYEYPDCDIPYFKPSVFENPPEEWYNYFDYLYKNESGIWGYIPYMYLEKGWVLIEDKDGNFLPHGDMKESDIDYSYEAPAISTGEDITPNGGVADIVYTPSAVTPNAGNKVVTVVIFAVAAVILSVVLLIVFGKKKNKE